MRSAVGITALIGGTIVAVSVYSKFVAPAETGSRSTTTNTTSSSRCARLTDPASSLAGLQRAGVVHMQDMNRLVVNDHAWFRLSGRQRAGVAVMYGCASGRGTIRVTSSTDGRVLARYVGGDYWEE